MIPDFNELKIGARVLVTDAMGTPLTMATVMDKVEEWPGVQTVLVNTGSGARRCFRYVSVSRLRKAE